MRQPTIRATLLATAVAIAIAACGDTADPAATGAPATTVPPPADTTTSPPVDTSLVPSPTPAPGKPDPDMPDVPLPVIPEGVDPTQVGYVVTAVDMLADMTGADPADIEVVGFEEVVWRDGSIGCPQPGMNYTQALVDGTRVALELDGDVYLFHASGTGDPFYCENPAEPLA